MDDAFYKELQEDFLKESLSLVERLEAIFLDAGNAKSDTINEAFRIAHTIKGGSSAVGFTDISEYTHKVEDFLSKFREQPEVLDEQAVSILLEFSDIINKELNCRLQGQKGDFFTESSLAKIKNYVFASGTPADSSTAASSEMKHGTEMEAATETPVETPPHIMSLEEAVAKFNFEAAVQTPSNDEQKPVAPASAATVEPTKSTEPTNVIELAKAQPAAKKPAAGGPSDGQPKKAVQTTVKVDVARLESIFDTIGEVVVFKNQMKEHLKKQLELDHHVQSISENLDILVKDLYEKALGLRMTPLQPLFQRVQRTLRDLSLQLNKKVKIRVVGEETEIDRNLFETLTDPMIHLIRNAIDHGVETQEERAKTNKDQEALIEIKAYHQAGQVIIEICDDGRGVNTEKVFNIALKKGLIPATSQMSSFTDEQIQNFLFLPGFSTADKISDLSGRGVGLDVVKTSIDSFHGKIQIKSQFGVGTRFILSLPLTTALIDGIVFKLAQQRFIVPTSAINSIHRLTPDDLTYSGDGYCYLNKFAEPIPVVNLESYFDLNSQKKSLVAVISKLDGQDVALLFTEVQSQVQAVVKPLPEQQKRTEYIGAAVLGDGLTTIILDLHSAVLNYRARLKETA